MKHRKNDRFRIEVKVTKICPSEDGTFYQTTQSGFEEKTIWFTQKELDFSKKIEPEYEEDEYYWCKWCDASDEDPWCFVEGLFCRNSITEKPSRMHYIGPKCERPEKE